MIIVEVYLDNAATTKMDDRVLEEMLPYLKDNYGNPYAVIVLNTDSQTDFYERMEQMLEAISS